VWKSTPTDLGAAGLGFELYFVFLKQMILLFTMLTILSIPILVLNLAGGYLSEAEKTSPFESSTLGNQKSLPDELLKSDNVRKTIRDHKRVMHMTLYTDIAYVLIILS
jgi:hypothetical protein